MTSYQCNVCDLFIFSNYKAMRQLLCVSGFGILKYVHKIFYMGYWNVEEVIAKYW